MPKLVIDILVSDEGNRANALSPKRYQAEEPENENTSARHVFRLPTQDAIHLFFTRAELRYRLTGISFHIKYVPLKIFMRPSILDFLLKKN